MEPLKRQSESHKEVIELQLGRRMQLPARMDVPSDCLAANL